MVGHKIKTGFIALLMIFVSSYAQSGGRMNTLYFIDVDVEGVKSDIRINGVPVVREMSGSVKVTEPVNKWLFPGENHLNVKLFSLEDDKPITGRVNISLFLHDETEDFPTPKNVLAKYTFPNNEYDGSSSSDHTESFEIKNITSGEISEKAEPISDLEEEEIKKILQLVESLRSALMKGDYQKAVDIQEFKIQEDARLEGLDVNELLKAAEEGYQMIGNEKNLNSAPLDEGNIEIEPVWGGKMFMVRRKDGSEALEIESDDLAFAIPIFVSKISGEWTIVR